MVVKISSFNIKAVSHRMISGRYWTLVFCSSVKEVSYLGISMKSLVSD